MTLESRISKEGMESCPMCMWLNDRMSKIQTEFLYQADIASNTHPSEALEQMRAALEFLQKTVNQFRETRGIHVRTYHPAVADEESLPW